MMKKIKYKYCNNQITIRSNSDTMVMFDPKTKKRVIKQAWTN